MIASDILITTPHHSILNVLIFFFVELCLQDIFISLTFPFSLHDSRRLLVVFTQFSSCISLHTFRSSHRLNVKWMKWHEHATLHCCVYFSELKAWEKRSHWMRLKLKLLSWWCVTFAHSFLFIFRECYPHLHVYIPSVSLLRALRCVDNWFFSLQILWRFWRLKIDQFVPYRKDLTHCTLSIVRLTKKGSLSGISISSITTHWKF